MAGYYPYLSCHCTLHAGHSSWYVLTSSNCFWCLTTFSVDGPVALYLNFLIDLSVSMLIKLISVIIVTPLFLVPGIIVFAMGGLCGQIYIKAQLSVRVFLH